MADRTSILIVGNGGREHALAWKIAQDSSRPEIFCAPGNAGTAAHGVNLDIPATDVPRLLDWAGKNRPDLTVVGPEAPLCAGIVDVFNASGLRIFGPTSAAAQLEGSKIFSKEIMQSAGVPTAESRAFSRADDARAYVRSRGAPIVVKADGLASGKGVTVCATEVEAIAAVDEALVRNAFGDAGSRVLVEEFLAGPEVSILALIDGEHVVMLDSAQDHKRVHDGDQGPNTGGMGAYSPAPVVTRDQLSVIRESVFGRTLTELKRRGIVYKGVLYAGLILTSKGIKVLEFNCRFGDPETQAILPRWDGDILPALNACVDGTLGEHHVRWKKDASVCVVIASGGYPGPYATGDEITGLGATNGALVFHAGTATRGGKVVTAGGRVLGVVGLGNNLRDAIGNAYGAAGHINFRGAHYRRDIGWRALE